MANYFEEANFNYDVNEAPYFEFNDNDVDMQTILKFAYYYACK